MRVLLMRLDAPLMSFGAPIVDNFGVVQDMPALSMLTGLFANALGYEHGDAKRLMRLQDRIRYAACRDRAGEKLTDFQTVDFSGGTEDLKEARMVGWTTRGRVEQRAGSNDTLREKHIRYRDYWADAIYTVAVTLEAHDEAPSVDQLADAIREPERPLFIGRKTCLPSCPLFLKVMDAPSLIAGLQMTDVDPRFDQGSPSLWFEEGDEVAPAQSTLLAVGDERDWSTQLHGGQRLVRHSRLRRTGGHGVEHG